MDEFVAPSIVPPATAGNLTNLIAERAWFEPDRITVSRPLGDGWQPVTAKEFEAEIRAVAKGLIAAGVLIGERVAIMAKTRYEWTVLDFAIWFAGAIVVPIYETSSAEQVEWILNDSGTKALIVETPLLAELARSVLPKECNRGLWIITEDALATLIAEGAAISDDEINLRRNSLYPDTLATLIYTSGTTGKPKGVELTHGNFLSECGNVVQSHADLFLKPGGSTLLFLPVAHVFGRMVEIGAINAGLHMAHCGDISRLPKDLTSFKPTFVLAVPRIFEKIYNGAEARAEAAGKGHIFRKAASVAEKYSEGLDTGNIPFALKAKHMVFDKLVYSKIRNGMGGRVEAAISGGAPLGARLGHFYRGAGIKILEGYGLTETTAGATLNTTGQYRIGSVGRPVPGTTVRLAEDGEVLIKGAIVMRGYWQNDAANKEAFTEDGFFKSGDLGALDSDGFLSIVGRKKELIVTSGGKNVAPAVLEDRVRAHPLVSQCMVVGDNQPYIAALITLDSDAIKAWAATNNKTDGTVANLIHDSTLISVIQTAVDEANKAVSRAESIRKFSLLPVDFTIAGGQLTAKLSVKRHVVAQQFASEISALFEK